MTIRGVWAGYKGKPIESEPNTRIPINLLTKTKTDSNYPSEKARLAIGITTLFTIAVATIGLVTLIGRVVSGSSGGF